MAYEFEEQSPDAYTEVIPQALDALPEQEMDDEFVAYIDQDEEQPTYTETEMYIINDLNDALAQQLYDEYETRMDQTRDSYLQIYDLGRDVEDHNDYKAEEIGSASLDDSFYKSIQELPGGLEHAAYQGTQFESLLGNQIDHSPENRNEMYGQIAISRGYVIPEYRVSDYRVDDNKRGNSDEIKQEKAGIDQIRTHDPNFGKYLGLFDTTGRNNGERHPDIITRSYQPEEFYDNVLANLTDQNNPPFGGKEEFLKHVDPGSCRLELIHPDRDAKVGMMQVVSNGKDVEHQTSQGKTILNRVPAFDLVTIRFNYGQGDTVSHKVDTFLTDPTGRTLAHCTGLHSVLENPQYSSPDGYIRAADRFDAKSIDSYQIKGETLQVTNQDYVKMRANVDRQIPKLMNKITSVMREEVKRYPDSASIDAVAKPYQYKVEDNLLLAEKLKRTELTQDVARIKQDLEQIRSLKGDGPVSQEEKAARISYFEDLHTYTQHRSDLFAENGWVDQTNHAISVNGFLNNLKDQIEIRPKASEIKNLETAVIKYNDVQQLTQTGRVPNQTDKISEAQSYIDTKAEAYNEKIDHLNESDQSKAEQKIYKQESTGDYYTYFGMRVEASRESDEIGYSGKSAILFHYDKDMDQSEDKLPEGQRADHVLIAPNGIYQTRISHCSDISRRFVNDSHASEEIYTDTERINHGNEDRKLTIDDIAPESLQHLSDLVEEKGADGVSSMTKRELEQEGIEFLTDNPDPVGIDVSVDEEKDPDEEDGKTDAESEKEPFKSADNTNGSANEPTINRQKVFEKTDPGKKDERGRSFARNLNLDKGVSLSGDAKKEINDRAEREASGRNVSKEDLVKKYTQEKINQLSNIRDKILTNVEIQDRHNLDPNLNARYVPYMYRDYLTVRYAKQYCDAGGKIGSDEFLRMKVNGVNLFGSFTRLLNTNVFESSVLAMMEAIVHRSEEKQDRIEKQEQYAAESAKDRVDESLKDNTTSDNASETKTDADAEPEDSIDKPAEDSSEENPEDSVDEPSEDSVNEPSEDSADETSEDGADETSDDSVDKPAEDDVDESPDDSVDKSAEDGSDENPEDRADEPSENSVDEPKEDGADETSDDSVDKPAEDDVDENPEDSVDEPSEDDVDESPDDSVDKSAEDGSDENPEDRADEPSENSVDEPKEDSADENPGDSVDKPAEDGPDENPDDTADEPAEDGVDENPEDSADEPSEDGADENLNDSVDETPKDSVDKPAEDGPDENPDDSVDEPAENGSDENPDDSVDEPAEDGADENPDDSIDETPKESPNLDSEQENKTDAAMVDEDEVEGKKEENPEKNTSTETTGPKQDLEQNHDNPTSVSSETSSQDPADSNIEFSNAIDDCLNGADSITDVLSDFSDYLSDYGQDAIDAVKNVATNYLNESGSTNEDTMDTLADVMSTFSIAFADPFAVAVNLADSIGAGDANLSSDLMIKCADAMDQMIPHDSPLSLLDGVQTNLTTGDFPDNNADNISSADVLSDAVDHVIDFAENVDFTANDVVSNLADQIEKSMGTDSGIDVDGLQADLTDAVVNDGWNGLDIGSQNYQDTLQDAILEMINTQTLDRTDTGMNDLENAQNDLTQEANDPNQFADSEAMRNLEEIMRQNMELDKLKNAKDDKASKVERPQQDVENTQPKGNGKVDNSDSDPVEPTRGGGR